MSFNRVFSAVIVSLCEEICRVKGWRNPFSFPGAFLDGEKVFSSQQEISMKKKTVRRNEISFYNFMLLPMIRSRLNAWEEQIAMMKCFSLISPMILEITDFNVHGLLIFCSFQAKVQKLYKWIHLSMGDNRTFLVITPLQGQRKSRGISWKFHKCRELEAMLIKMLWVETLLGLKFSPHFTSNITHLSLSSYLNDLVKHLLCTRRKSRFQFEFFRRVEEKWNITDSSWGNELLIHLEFKLSRGFQNFRSFALIREWKQNFSSTQNSKNSPVLLSSVLQAEFLLCNFHRTIQLEERK